jgi:hypothetical protein
MMQTPMHSLPRCKTDASSRTRQSKTGCSNAHKTQNLPVGTGGITGEQGKVTPAINKEKKRLMNVK